MKAELNFTNGSLKGFFVVFIEGGTRIYATELIFMASESRLRCNTYYIESNKGGADSAGQMRPSLKEIEKIEIRGDKY